MKQNTAAILLVAAAICAGPLTAQTPAPAPAAPAAAKTLPSLTLTDLFSEETVPDTAISPSGRYIAAVARRPDMDLIVVIDTVGGDKKFVTKAMRKELGPKLDVHIAHVYWKSEDRILMRLQSRLAEGYDWSDLSDSKMARYGDRMMALNRDGSNIISLLSENRSSAMQGAFNLGLVASFLPNDPNNILMIVDGWDGASIFKADVNTGKGEMIEKPSQSVVQWWLDVNGVPTVRVEISLGTMRFLRKDETGKWRKFHSIRLRNMEAQPEYEHVSASDQPMRHYVLARPPGKDRMGLYLYDIEKESFGDVIVENPKYDITSVRISRDGKRVLWYCYTAHVRVCESTEPRTNAHMRGVRKYFKENANVFVYDAAQGNESFIMYVYGPSEPPSYYYYRTKEATIELLGLENSVFSDKALPVASVVSWKARDGKELTGYLTRPPNSDGAKNLPLIAYIHGGPEARDALTFDTYVQFLTARGYAVFQPNFRGSSGFGKAFIESGHGEWGRKMQDDITDGLDHLVKQQVADPARVCIVGASYGGYAALAGTTFTPDLYKCAVSMAGISDVAEMLKHEKKRFGGDSETFEYIKRLIADPEKDQERIAAISPIKHLSAIKTPILLVHGEDDAIVDIEQSAMMKKALDKAGRPTELIRLKNEGHSYWDTANHKLVLTAIDNFLWKHIGAGHNIKEPPAPPVVAKKGKK
jgi:acetyl esterase/lipase